MYYIILYLYDKKEISTKMKISYRTISIRKILIIEKYNLTGTSLTIHRGERTVLGLIMS